MENITGGKGKLLNEELDNFLPHQIIIRMMKSRRMRWVSHVAFIREKRTARKY
jgi:hypothetical protein